MTNTTFTISDFDRVRLRRIETIADDLRLFGLLSDKEAAEVEKVLNRIDEARVTGTNGQERITSARNAIAEKVLAGEIAIEAIDTETSKILDAEHVVRITEHVTSKLIQAAGKLTYAHAERAPGVLNTELEAISARGVELAAQLVGITSSDAALHAGRGEQWLEVTDLMASYSRIASLAAELREAGVLAKADRVSPWGAWWKFKTPVGLGKRRPADEDRRVLFLDQCAAGLWLPASEQEAESVRSVHETAEDEFQANLYGIAR